MRWDFAHLPYERKRGVHGGLRRLQARNDLDAFLHRNGVHEMRADDTGWAGEIGRVVAAGCGRDLSDRNGGRIGGENGMWGADPGEFGEDGRFQRRDLRDSLNDEVGG